MSILKFWSQFFMPVRLYGGGGSAGSDAQGRAEQQLANISQEQWNYYKSSWLPGASTAMYYANDANNRTQDYYDSQYIPQAQQISNQIQAESQSAVNTDNTNANAASAQAQSQFGQANQDNAAYNKDFIGTLDEMKAQADQTGGEADQEYQSMLARGDVDQQFANSNASLIAREQQAGVGANSGQMLAVMQQNDVARAAASASAQTQARQAAKNLGWTYKNQVAQTASGLSGAASSASAAGSNAAGVGTAASAAGVAASQAPLTGINAVAGGYQGAAGAAAANLGNYQNLSSGLNGGASSATQAAGQSGSIAGQQAQAEASQSAATSQAIGTGIGAAAAVGTAAIVI